MIHRRWPLPFVVLAVVAALPACMVRTTADTPGYVQAPPAYAPPSPYAAPAGAEATVAAPYDPYCAEAVGEAQAAAAQASVTGTPRDVGRAQRTASYTRRDCR